MLFICLYYPKANLRCATDTNNIYMDYLLKAAKHVPYILMFSLLHTNVPFIVVVPCLLLARILTAAEHKFIMFNAIFNTANMLYDVYCRYCWTYLFIYRLVTLFLMEFNHKTLVFALQKTHLIWKRCHLKLQIFTTFFFCLLSFYLNWFCSFKPFCNENLLNKHSKKLTNFKL